MPNNLLGMFSYAHKPVVLCSQAAELSTEPPCRSLAALGAPLLYRTG